MNLLENTTTRWDFQSVLNDISAARKAYNSAGNYTVDPNELSDSEMLRYEARNNNKTLRTQYSDILTKYPELYNMVDASGNILESATELMSLMSEEDKSAAQTFLEKYAANKALYEIGDNSELAWVGQTYTDEEIDSWYDAENNPTQAFNDLLDEITDNERVRQLQTYFTTLQAAKNAYDEYEETYRQATENLKSLTDESMQEIFDKYSELEQKVLDMIEQNYQEEREIYDNAHNERLEMIQDEQEAYRKLNNEIIDRLSDLKSENDYNDQLSDAEKEANEIRAKIAALSMQTDLASATERAELQQQLADKEEEILETQRDHQYQATVDALQKDAETQDEYFSDITDAENEYYEWQQELLEERYAQEERYAMAYEAMATGVFNLIKATGDETYNSIYETGVGTVMSLTEAYNQYALETGEAFTNLGTDVEQFTALMSDANEILNIASDTLRSWMQGNLAYGNNTELSIGSGNALSAPTTDANEVNGWGTVITETGRT